jgi:hypothetical protein
MIDTKAMAETIAKIQETEFGKLIQELHTVREHPRMLTLVSHGFLESMIEAMIAAKCKQAKKINGDNRGFPYSIKVLMLHEMGIVSEHHLRLLDWFRKLRNDFAHKPFMTLTPERLELFVDPQFRQPEKFIGLCNAILWDFYWTHEDVIGHVFMPSFYTQVEREFIQVQEPAPTYRIDNRSKNHPTLSRSRGQRRACGSLGRT